VLPGPTWSFTVEPAASVDGSSMRASSKKWCVLLPMMFGVLM
jgi:hypothetical protein